jgi:hypothetical protein
MRVFVPILAGPVVAAPIPGIVLVPAASAHRRAFSSFVGAARRS